MSKNSKIVIGIIVAIIVIGVGYVLLHGRGNTANQHTILQGSPYDAEHLQRTLNQGGTPGDGGGG